MQEIHDPDFRLNKQTMKNIDSKGDNNEMKYTIYRLD